MEEKKDNIEKAVCVYFKIKPKDLYSLNKRKYPYGIARDIFTFFLHKEGYSTNYIARLFSYATTMVYRHCGEIENALKSDTKIREDVEIIKEIVNNEYGENLQ